MIQQTETYQNGKKTKKVNRIIMVLAVLLVLSTLKITAFAADEDKNYTLQDYSAPNITEQAISYLKMMQIIEDVDTNAHLNKGQAVIYIIRSIGLEDIGRQMNGVYTYEEKMASVAHSCGILAGNVPSEWNLSDDITLSQSAKMLVSALGYQSVLTAPNAYPTQYLMQAAKLGITKYTLITDTDYITTGDFLVMLYQTMQAETLTFSGITNEGVLYKVKGECKLEDTYLDAKEWVKSEGIVESDYYSSIIKNETSNYSRMRINGVFYACESEQMRGFVGLKVDFVYVESNTESGRKMIGINANEDNVVYRFDRNQDLKKENNCMIFSDENDREKKLNLANGAVFVLNNQILTSYSDNEFDFSKAMVTVIDNNNDQQYEIVKVSVSESMVVNYVKDDKIYIKNGSLYSKKVIDLSDTDDISLIMHDLDGSPVVLTDIGEESTISVIASSDLKFIEIILLQDLFEGRITAYDSENEELTVDGKIYGLKISTEELKIGNTYKFRVNEDNEIFWYDTLLRDCVYLADKSENNTGLNDDVQVKIFDNTKGIQVYNTADKVMIDNISYSDKLSVYNAIPTQTLVYISLNGDDKIKKIESLQAYGEKAQRQYQKQASGFNDLENNESIPFKFDSDTELFFVPQSGNDSDYGVTVPLKNSDEYLTQAFGFDKDTKLVKAVVVTVNTDQRSDNYISFDSDMGIVKAITQVIAPDGQNAYKIILYHESEEITYYSGQYEDVFNVCSSLKAGDVIRYIANYNNEIVRLKRIICFDNTVDFFHDGRDTVDEQIYGQVIMLNKNSMTNYGKYLYHEISVSTALSYSSLVFMRICADLTNPYDSDYEFCDYYCYNKKTKKVTPASIDDIVTYEDVGTDASKVFIQRSKSEVQFVVIVKDK